MASPLSVLGLNPGSTLDQARDRYRVLAKKYHPDKGSPSSERFLELRDAMDALEGDPSILHVRDFIPERSSGSDLWVTSVVKVEDIVFRDSISVVVHPKAPCPSCSGTGASDFQYHTCLVCGGKGRIPGDIMRMMAGSNECPGCTGTGVHIPHDLACKLCKGHSVVPSVRMKKIATGPLLMAGGNHKFMYAGEGHSGAYGGKVGDLHLVIKIEGTSGLEFVNGKAVVWVEVTPATFVVGGKVSVEILGEMVVGTMQPMTGRADVLFRGKPVQIRASIVIPLRISKEMQQQYASMRAQELREGRVGAVVPLQAEKKEEGWSRRASDKYVPKKASKPPRHPLKKSLSKKRPPTV